MLYKEMERKTHDAHVARSRMLFLHTVSDDASNSLHYSLTQTSQTRKTTIGFGTLYLYFNLPTVS